MLALIEGGGVDLIVNTPWGRGARTDGYLIRRKALTHGVPCITTLAGRRRRNPGDRVEDKRRHAAGQPAPEPPRDEGVSRSVKLHRVEVLEREKFGDHALLRYRWNGEPPQPGQFVMVRTENAAPTFDPFLSRPLFVHDYVDGVASLLFEVRGHGTALPGPGKRPRGGQRAVGAWVRYRRRWTRCAGGWGSLDLPASSSSPGP